MSSSSGTQSACGGPILLRHHRDQLPVSRILCRGATGWPVLAWFPGLYCGLPLFSESQAGYLHPFKYLLYPWLAPWQAFNLDTVLSIWLTGTGTYLWLRRHVSSAAALTGCAVFGLSGFMWAHLIHTSMVNALASVPFVIWGLESSWDSGRWRGVVLGGLALACQVFAGHLQDTLLTALLVGLYGVYRALTEQTLGRRAWALSMALVLAALGGLCSAVQWVPSKELLDRSPRWGPEPTRSDVWFVAPRTAADVGRAGGIRHPGPRYRLDGRLLSLPRDERLYGLDGDGAGRDRRRGHRPAGSLDQFLGVARRRGQRLDARPVYLFV